MKQKGKAIMKHQNKVAAPSDEVSEDFKAGTTERPRHGLADRDEPKSARDEINKQIAGNEAWIADHADDAAGVVQRQQAIAELQHRLIDLDVFERDGRT